MHLQVAVLVTLALAGPVFGYPQGAPTGACKDMFPNGHNVSARNTEAPYNIMTNATSYMPNSNVTVTLTAIAPGYYEGVFIQARRAVCDGNHDDPVGTFMITGNREQGLLKLINCGSGSQNAVSHSTKEKKKTLTFIWAAPSATVGTIYFRGTFVKETDEFWTTVSSDFVSYGQSSTEGAVKCAVRTTSTGNHISAHAHYFLFCFAFLTWYIATFRVV